MADYSLLGSFGSEASSSLNADLITKLKDAERAAILSTLDSNLEDITGLDAETGEALDFLGESDTFTLIQAQVYDFMSTISSFDLDSGSINAFDSVSASTTGTAAIFDANDVGGLEPGTTNVTVTQLAQKDVYQSISFNETIKDGQLTADDEGSVALVASAGININLNGEDHFFNIVQDPGAATIAEMGAKTIEELAAEINETDGLIASVEQVGDDEYRLVVKSADAGVDNKITITQTNFSIGFTNAEYSSTAVDDTSVQIEGGNDLGDEVTINGISFSTEGKSYDDLANDINTYNAGATFNASVVAGQIVITRDDGADITISQTGVDLGFYNSESHHVQTAQNLNANIDGIDYNTSSNTVTIQGNLTMTAVELGTSTIDLQRDTATIMSSLEAVMESYNNLVDLIDEQVTNPDSTISDSSSFTTMLSSIKEMLFSTYGENDDLSLFNFGMDLDLTGHLTLDTTEFAEALVDNYDDLKDILIGNTVDEDLASSDATKYLGMGTILQDYLDSLDASDGLLTRYETSMMERQTDLEEEREEALEALDAKYESMSAQFAQYSALISQMESSFSGLSMMIEQSVASK